MPHPETAPHAAAFDELLARTPEGGEVDYHLPVPKWWFLHHLVTHGFLLHGSNEREIAEFETRANFDAHNVRRVDAVFASDDAIWPIYFAVVNRPVAQSYINWCEHPGTAPRATSFRSGPTRASLSRGRRAPCTSSPATPSCRRRTRAS
jgi:hypothetical protein